MEAVKDKINLVSPTVSKCRCGGTAELKFNPPYGFKIVCNKCYIRADTDVHVTFCSDIDEQMQNVISKWNRVMK